MMELNLNESKILDTSNHPIKIGYDTRIYAEYRHLPAACLFHKAKTLCKNGGFSISDEKFSNILGLSLRTFKRAKKMVKDRLDMQIGKGNKTYYTLKNDIPYDPISYRSFDLDHWLIMDNNYKGGAFLGQCLYWWNKSLEKGHLEFSKSDKQIIQDLPFLSHDILTSIKNIAILKGFITIRRKKRGSEWGISHYTVNPMRIEKAIKESKEHYSSHPSRNISSEQQAIVWVKIPKLCAKIPIECVPKSRLSVCQNPVSIINTSIDNSILSSAIDLNSFEKPNCDVVSEERNKFKNNKEGQQIEEYNQQPKMIEEEGMNEKKEIYQMIGIWKKTISIHESITVSSKLKDQLSEAFTHKFDNSMDKWKSYCEKISSISWLMGKNNTGWKAQLCWAIKPDKIDNILSGAYYEKKKSSSYKTVQKPIIPLKQNLIDEIIQSEEDIEIKKIKLSLIDSLSEVRHDIGLLAYHTYFRGAKFEISQSDGKKKLSINSGYGAYEGSLSFHGMVSMACNEFDEVILYGGKNDRLGNHIYMHRNQSKTKACHIWEKLSLDQKNYEVMEIKSGT